MKNKLFIFSMLAILLTSCYEYPDSDQLIHAEDQLVVITQVDEHFNFSDNKYFYVSDSITDVYVDASGNETVKREWAGKLRDQVIENMEKLEYILIDTVPQILEEKVLYFELVYVESKNVQATTYGYGWWYDYYSYYPYYWGGYYPMYYPSYTYYNTYESKMLMIDCHTLDNDRLKNHWIAAIRGVDHFEVNDVLPYIDQGFEQTPEFGELMIN